MHSSENSPACGIDAEHARVRFGRHAANFEKRWRFANQFLRVFLPPFLELVDPPREGFLFEGNGAHFLTSRCKRSACEKMGDHNHLEAA